MMKPNTLPIINKKTYHPFITLYYCSDITLLLFITADSAVYNLNLTLE